MKSKAIIIKLDEPFQGFNYNVQIWEHVRNSFQYCGRGRFCKSLEDATRYAKENADTIERRQ